MKALVRSITRTVLGDRRALPAAGDRRQVRLLATTRRDPVTLEESLIVRELAGGGSRAVDELVASISRALYRDEWRRGGWAADLAMFGSRLFAPDVATTLERGNGQLWTID